jgi:hypothetical protein
MAETPDRLCGLCVENAGDRIREIRVIRGKMDWDWGPEPKPRSLTADRTDDADAEGKRG